MKRRDREGPIHKAIYDYLCLVFPEPQAVYHCRNEINKRGKGIAIELAQAKRKGVIPGFPDLLVLPFSTLGPLFFEVKAEGGYASKPQKDMHDRLRRLGYRVAVVRSIDDVREALTEWSIPTRHIEGSA